MAYCGPRGIPHSHFMGGPNVWTPLDRQLAIEWSKRERSRCGGCGVPYVDWYLDDGTPDESSYKAEVYVCPGCSKAAAVNVKDDAAGTKKAIVPDRSAPLWQDS